MAPTTHRTTLPPPRDISTITVEAGASEALSQRSVSPTIDIAQLIAEQMATARHDMAKLVAEQVALALAAHQPGKTQSPPEQGIYERQATVISSVEPLATYETRSRDGPMRGIDAQELSDGIDPTFEAWRLQILARFRDDPGWYNSEERKLDYMLRRTRGDAQIHMIAGMKDETLPGFFEMAQEALTNLRQALVNPQALREA